jgi:hypothetical protein
MTPPRQKTWIKYIDFIKYIGRKLTNRISLQTNKVDCWQLIVRIGFPLVPLVLQDMKCRQKNSSVSRGHHISCRIFPLQKVWVFCFMKCSTSFLSLWYPPEHMRKKMKKKKHNCRSRDHFCSNTGTNSATSIWLNLSKKIKNCKSKISLKHWAVCEQMALPKVWPTLGV